jgi:hypothetical protein
VVLNTSIGKKYSTTVEKRAEISPIDIRLGMAKTPPVFFKPDDPAHAELDLLLY